MLSTNDITRLQTATGSQQCGNDIAGIIGFAGGFACSSAGLVLGQPVGNITVVPETGANQGCYRVYPNAPAGTIASIDWINVNGFTPQDPTVAETTCAMVTGFGIDAANNKNYVTVQIATLGTWAIQPTPPSNFVVGFNCSVTYTSQANPL